MIITRQERRQLDRDNAKRSSRLEPIPEDQWPEDGQRKRTAAYRNNRFLVQVFDEGNGIRRLSVNRMAYDAVRLRWVDGITGDELQEVKRQIGMGELFAVEIYPRDVDLVDVANMRHLWVLPEPLSFGWRAR